MLYKGSCHCGAVAYQVESEIDSGLACNCSICRRRASLLWFVPRDKLTVQQGADTLSTYTFNHHVIKHRFCPTCGIHTFGEGIDPEGNAMAAINLNCLDDVDLKQIPVHHYDGRSK